MPPSNQDGFEDPLAGEILAAIAKLRIDKQDYVPLTEICEEVQQSPDVAEVFLDELKHYKPPLIDEDGKNYRITPMGTMMLRKWENDKEKEQVKNTRQSRQQGNDLQFEEIVVPVVGMSRRVYYHVAKYVGTYLICVVPFAYLDDVFGGHNPEAFMGNLTEIQESLNDHFVIFGTSKIGEVIIQYWEKS